MTPRSRRILANTSLVLAFAMIALNLYALLDHGAPGWTRGWAVPGMFFAIAAMRLHRRPRR